MTKKTVSYFPDSLPGPAKPVIEAFLTGAKLHGLKSVENSLDCDYAVIWSVLWHGKMKVNKKVYNHYKKKNKPVIIVEVGALKRNITWKFCIDHITADGFYGHVDNLDFDRPKKLGLSLKEQTSNNGKILIASQHKASKQVENLTSLEDWVTTVVQQIKQYSDRDIDIRSHPRCRLNLPKAIQPKKLNNTYDDFDMTFNYHTIINYNSGPGMQGAINGSNIIVDKSSLAYPVSMQYKDIENPPVIDRERWFVELCHTEYTVAEIEQGIWYSRIKKRLT